MLHLKKKISKTHRHFSNNKMAPIYNTSLLSKQPRNETLQRFLGRIPYILPVKLPFRHITKLKTILKTAHDMFTTKWRPLNFTISRSFTSHRLRRKSPLYFCELNRRMTYAFSVTAWTKSIARERLELGDAAWTSFSPYVTSTCWETDG